MNVFVHELRINLRSTLIWAASLSFAGFFFIYIYPGFSADMESLNQLLSNYPPEVLKALGMGTDGLKTFHGFYSFIIIYPILCCAIQGLIMGIQVIGKEGARKTSDFLFTKPQRRTQILTGKYLAVMVSSILTSLVYILVTFISASAYGGDFERGIFFLLSSAFVFTGILFTAIGFCIGCFVKKAKSPTFMGIGVGALFFGLQMVSNMYDDRLLELISPMSYINPAYLAAHHAYDSPLLICLFVLMVVVTILGFVRFRSKDLHCA